MWSQFPLLVFSGRAVVSAGLGVHWLIRFFHNAKGPDGPTLLDL